MKIYKKIMFKLDLLIYFIKEAFKEALIAFKKGRECYFCDFYNYPTQCDMVKDETCFPNLINRFWFSIEMFFIEYRHTKKHFENFMKSESNEVNNEN